MYNIDDMDIFYNERDMKDKIEWTNVHILNNIGTYLIEKETLTKIDIKRLEMMLALIQYDLLMANKDPILTYKIYIYNNRIYHKYLSDVLQVRPLKNGQINNIYKKNTMFNMYKDMEFEELEQRIKLINENKKLEGYFVFNKYNGPNLIGYARLTTNKRYYIYLLLFNYFVIVPIMVISLVLFLIYLYFLGILDFSFYHYIDSLKSGIEILAFCSIIGGYSTYKMLMITKKSTEYESKLEESELIS